MFVVEFNRIKKYKFSNLKTLLAGSHYNLLIILKTLKYEKKIDYKSFQTIFQKYKYFSPDPGCSKYLDLPCHMSRAFFYAKKLELFKSRGLSIMDIGSGAGYFPFAASCLGHKACAIDLDDNPFYNDMKSLLNVSWQTCYIEPFKPIAQFKEKFDLITSFQTLYDRSNMQKFWTEAEWEYFINHLKNYHLNSRGKIFIQINTVAKRHLEQYKKNINLFLSLGGKILKPKGEFIFCF